MTCAKRFSLTWWAWVLQVASLVAIPVALTGGQLPAKVCSRVLLLVRDTEPAPE